MDTKLSALYYSPRGYWKGIGAIKKLAAAAGASEDAAKGWLKRQAIWQIYLPLPRRIPRPKFGVTVPNEVHQADLLFLPHDRVSCKTYKYALTVVDAASRYKEAEPLATKEAKGVAVALEKIYRRSPLGWPKLLQVDPGREFMGAVLQLLAKHGVQVRRGRVDVHRYQGIVERLNRTLAERLFGHQYAQEMSFRQRGSSSRSTEWVARLPAVVAALNNEVTRLTDKKPADAISAAEVPQRPSSVVPWPPRRFFRTEDPLRRGRSLSLSARRARGWPPSRDRPRVVPPGVPAWSLGHHARRACLILSSRWASPRVCQGGAARGAS